MLQKRVRLAGKEVTIKSTDRALRLGIGLLPESRKTQGLVLPFSVKDNIWLNKHACQFSLIRDNEERLTAERLISHVGVKTPDAGTAVGTLSGGNQQKVVISRWLNHDVNILILTNRLAVLMSERNQKSIRLCATSPPWVFQ